MNMNEQFLNEILYRSLILGGPFNTGWTGKLEVKTFNDDTYQVLVRKLENGDIDKGTPAKYEVIDYHRITKF